MKEMILKALKAGCAPSQSIGVQGMVICDLRSDLVLVDRRLLLLGEQGRVCKEVLVYGRC